MSVSNIVSSFSPTAFFKVYGEKLSQFSFVIPHFALIAGIGMGNFEYVLKEIQQINNKNPNDTPVKSLIAERVKLAKVILATTFALAYTGSVVIIIRPRFVVLIAATGVCGLGLLFAVILNIKNIVHDSLNSASFQGRTKKNWQKLSIVLLVL
jgi:hypothetical protein